MLQYFFLPIVLLICTPLTGNTGVLLFLFMIKSVSLVNTLTVAPVSINKCIFSPSISHLKYGLMLWLLAGKLLIVCISAPAVIVFDVFSVLIWLNKLIWLCCSIISAVILLCIAIAAVIPPVISLVIVVICVVNVPSTIFVATSSVLFFA